MANAIEFVQAGAPAARSRIVRSAGRSGVFVVEANRLPRCYALHLAAQAHRARLCARFSTAASQVVTAAARRFIARWQQRQRAHAIYCALRALDPRLLSDLGLHSSEIASVAAEMAAAAATRRCTAERVDEKGERALRFAPGRCWPTPLSAAAGKRRIAYEIDTYRRETSMQPPLVTMRVC